MYLPEHFEERDSREIAQIIQQFPLAVIVCMNGKEIVANHIPLMMDGENELIGHIAASNNLHQIIENNAKMLAIFSAENSYISPNLYPTKQETHRHVPTWNYQVIHVHGRITFLHVKKQKVAIVGKLTKLHEQEFSGKKAWRMSDAPKDYMEGMIENIVAFKIKIESICAKSKLSQNRDKIDFDAVSGAMRNSGKNTLYKAMERLNIPKI